MKSVEDRLVYLEAHLNSDTQTEMLRSGNEVRDSARFAAMKSILLEVCEELGISSDRFFTCFEEREAVWHGVRLAEVREIDPHLAGQLDRRDLSDVATVDGYSRIFPQTSSPPPA